MKVKLDQLPIGYSPRLLKRALLLTTPTEQNVPVTPFMALIMLLGNRFDELLTSGILKPAEMQVVFMQISAITQEEGGIGGTQGYALPGVLNFLLYLIFFIYYLLLILCDLGASNGWQSLWIVSVLIVTNFGVCQ